jgi:exodeoxyribonuclease VII small subunit
MDQPHGVADAPADEQQGFEAHIRRLETLVVRLERDELALDEAMAVYEQGIALARRCHELLEAVELKLRQVDPNGRDAGAVSL